MANVPHKLFTYSRRAGGPMVCEHSTLAANVPGFPRAAIPNSFFVEGQRRSVLYRRAQHLDVWDAGHEDLVAMVFLPAEDRNVLPQVHVLNT